MNFKEHQEKVRDGEIKPIVGSCTRCAGWGYTPKESPVVSVGHNRPLGSGCPRCLGDGIDPEWAMTVGVDKPNLTACRFD